MNFTVLSAALTFALAIAKPHYEEGTAIQWEPPGDDDCMTTKNILLLHERLTVRR